MSTQETLPFKTYTVKDFIAMGKSDTIVSYTKLSFMEKNEHISYVVKNIFEDYKEEFLELSVKVQLDDRELLKYKYNPKLLSYDLYNTTELYIFILLLNDMCNIREFDESILWLVPRDKLIGALSTIYSAEKNDILSYNTEHNT